jgi:ribosome-associated translation inhibitor RaiA
LQDTVGAQDRESHGFRAGIGILQPSVAFSTTADYTDGTANWVHFSNQELGPGLFSPAILPAILLRPGPARTGPRRAGCCFECQSNEDTVMNVREELEKFRDGLLQQRDELRVQLNLAKREAKEEWDHTEAKLEEFKARLDSVALEAKEASGDVWDSVKLLGEEIKTAYERIKSRL